MTPMFDDERSTRHYTGTNAGVYEAKRRIPDAAFAWVARLRAEKLSPQIAPGDTVVEYGVGFGWNLAVLSCTRRIGFDVTDAHAETLRQRGIEFVPNPRQVEAGKADVVICHHTLEHVLNPASVLREMHRMLRPGGRLLLFVPFEKERRYRTFNPAEPNHHLYSWNVQTLGNLVAEVGFEIAEAKIGEFGYDRVAAVWAEKLRVGESGFRMLRAVAHLARPASEVRIVATKS